ncbi:uncharacterized protein PSFLO_02370 [Pseudozyma flocculosa]|uniref:Uncharacterized protein n=2 Tax=Pseudozyma flocculosa TaxID=84751 RepID=A0A5C3F0D7_9BASI|nr:uncharacterized protein PSFLO_02370 [Pseudozyma flocculosa]
MSFKGRKLFGGSCADSPDPSEASAASRRTKPRSATISMMPGTKRVHSPLLPTGWFGKSQEDDSISSRLQGSSSSCSPAGPSPSISAASDLMMPDRSSNNASPSLPVQPGAQQQGDKLQRRRRSFFFKKRKGGAGGEDAASAAAAVELPPLPFASTHTYTPPRPQPVVSAKKLEARRLQDEQNLAALERVSDLVCQSVATAVIEPLTPPGPRGGISVAAVERRLASSSYASLASPPFSDCGEDRVQSPSVGGSYTQSSEGGWLSDASEFALYQRTPPDQSVLDRVLLPSSMKSIKREGRRHRPAALDLTAERPPSTRSGSDVGLPRSATLRGSIDAADFDLYLKSPTWIPEAVQGPAPPPRPGRSGSQRMRTASLSMPRSRPPSSDQLSPTSPTSPGSRKSHRTTLSTISSNSSTEDLGRTMHSPRSRMSMGDIDSRPSTRHPTVDSPFATPTFGYDPPWGQFP